MHKRFASLHGLALLALFCAGRSALAQGVLRLDFEGPQPTWQGGSADTEYRLDSQERVRGAAQSGDWCEQARIAAGNGSYVYLRHEIGTARVIQELRASVWIKSDRTGIGMLARAVLPRTIDSKTGQPRSVLLRGATYSRPGHWQKLQLADLPRHVEREAVLLRTQVGPNVDTREAYLDQVLLNVYGGPGVTQVWIDDLVIEGLVGQAPGKPAELPDQSKPAETAKPESNLARWTNAGNKVADDLNRPQTVELNGSLLLVDGRPFFPRLIQHQGEPLHFLKDLGFNGVKLARFPSSALLAEAEKTGMWIVAPPPAFAAPLASEQLPAERNNPDLKHILVWHLGDGLTGRDLETTRQWSEALRAADRRVSRPISADVDDQLQGYSRHIDLLSASRYPLLSSMDLGEYGTWLHERPRVARPGTSIWTSIDTQPAAVLLDQLSLLHGNPSTTPTITGEQIRLATLSAVAAGVKGLCFRSQTRLDGPEPATRQRALTLELLNLELDLIEPWCSGGNPISSVTGSDPQAHGTLLQSQRARLLIALWVSKHAQLVPGQSAGNNVSFTVPGVPETSDAYEIAPTGLRNLRPKQRRVTGGVRFTLDEFGPATLVLLSPDPLVVNSIAKKLERTARRAAQLQRDLAAARLAEVSATDRVLVNVGPALTESSGWMTSARELLTQADGALAANNSPQAYSLSQRSLRSVRSLERAHWDKAVAAASSPMSRAELASFATLPLFWTAQKSDKSATWSLNQLAGGDFEDLDRLLQLGWRHFQHPQQKIESDAQLAYDNPHSGRASLALRSWSTAKDPSNGLVESPPIWINSAPIEVDEGQLLRIHGWAHVPGPITASVDGLMIIDSITGPALADRIGQTKAWQEFTYYRVANRPGQFVVTFALTGFGAARIDDVTIERLTVPRLPSNPRLQQILLVLRNLLGAQYRIERLPPVR